jgi:hypothetical protein
MIISFAPQYIRGWWIDQDDETPQTMYRNPSLPKELHKDKDGFCSKTKTAHPIFQKYGHLLLFLCTLPGCVFVLLLSLIPLDDPSKGGQYNWSYLVVYCGQFETHFAFTASSFSVDAFPTRRYLARVVFLLLDGDFFRIYEGLFYLGLSL